ncbi:hypothetical protein BC829DRAFT_488393 [Chytridium lagenaria]|nr:hypothetical protein BC829DRAFT_488393 [Chytridium lagenaria]
MIPEVVAELIKNFVNRSLLFKLNEVMPKNDGLKKGGDNTVKGPDFNILRKRASGTEKTEGQTSGLVRSEYRTVSIMFVKVHGDFDADRAQMFFVKLLGQLDLFNGVFQQYSVDDKGQSMLACFGLPPFANEKCGLIAVRAASRFAQSLLAEDLSKISISVTTGDILFGTVGWEYRKDAALLGDTVNIAARLLSIDKGVILLDDRTKELVKGTFTLSNLGLIRIKGKSLPLSVWAISSFTAMAAKTTNLSESWTQNKAERQILNQSVRLWVERRMLKSTFLVEGESGMGKTTLLVSVQNLYKELSVLSCIARGSEVDQLNSFMAVRDILMQLLKIRLACASTRDSSLTISTIVTTGRTSVIDSSLFGLDKGDMEGILRDANENIGFASLLLVMIKGDSCSTYKAEDDKSGRASVNGTRKDGAGFMNDEVRRRALKFALVRVISHLCVKYRVAIMLDDAQWIDFSSLEVFYILADEHPDVYMTIFTRPIKNVESGSFLHRFLASTFVHHLPLVGMSLEDLSIILAQYMNAKSVESKLLNDIYQQTHGNLLQTESLLRYLLEHFDEVVVVDKNGQLCGKNYEALQMIVSRSVEAVIMSQFDRLHTEYQHILRYASILGQYVDLHELSLLLDAENVQADDIRSLIAIHDQFDFLRPCEGAFADSGSEASLESKDRYLLEPLFHCRILANLAMTKANLRDFPGALDAAVKCIDFAGLDWPTHPKAIKKRILRLFRRTVKHWIKSNNGRSNIRVSTKSPKELQPDWFPIISIALDTFILIISYASLNKLHTVLVVLWSLSQAYVTSETDPSFLFKILFYSSWICALHGGSVACKLSWVMMKQCRTLQPRCDSTIKSLFHIYYTLMFLYFGTTRRSLEAVREYEEYWMERRVKFQYYKALDFYGIFSIYNGDLKYLKPRLTDEWAAEMKSIDIFWYCAITGVYQIDCFLKNDVESLEKFNTRQKEVQHLVPILTILRCGSSIKVNDLFLLILRGSPGNVLLEASANALLEVIEVGVSASHHTPTIAALSVCIPTVGLCNAGLPLNADAVKRLIVLLSKFRKEVKVMSRYGWLVKFGSLLALTSTYHLMGAPSKIVKQVRRLLALPEFKDDIHMGGDKCFVGACCCAIIALSSRDESEVRVNRKRAIEMFEEMGLWVMIKWVSNEMKYAEQ